MGKRTGLLLVGLLASCEEGKGPDPSSDGSTGGGDMASQMVLSFDVETVDALGTGEGTQVVVDAQGRAHVLYFSQGTEKDCTRGPTPTKYRGAQLFHSIRTAPMTFSMPTRVSAGEDAVVNGLSALLDPTSKQPVVAYQGGLPGLRYCGGSDMVLARYDGTSWKNTRVADASQAGVGPVETSGDVVGYWPALAVGKLGWFLAWQDNHYAFAKDDSFKADLEMATSQNGMSFATAEGVAQDGAGLYNTLAIDGQGRPVLAYSGVRDGGVTVALRTAMGMYQRTRLQEGGPVLSSIAAAPSGKLGIAYYDGDNRVLRFRESDDGIKWGDAEVVDRDGDVGRYMSLRYAQDGTPVLAYYNCGNYRPGQGCDPATDSVRVARRGKDGLFVTGNVDTGGDGACGAFVSLALGQDGKAHLAYQCNLYDHKSGQFKAAVRYAVEK